MGDRICANYDTYLVDASRDELSERFGAVPTVLELESWTPEEEEPDERPDADDTLQSPAEEDAVDSVSKAILDWVVGAAEVGKTDICQEIEEQFNS